MSYLLCLFKKTKEGCLSVTARDRYIVSTLETIKEEIIILKKMVMNLSKTNQMGMTLPEDISLPLTSLEDVNFLEDQLEDRKKMQELVRK